MCFKGEVVKSVNVTHTGHLQVLSDQDAPYPLSHQHPCQRCGCKRPARKSQLARAAVLCLVFWPNSTLPGGLFTVLVKFQSGAYTASAHCICFCVL